MCSSDPRSLRIALTEANAVGDALVAIELTVDGDPAGRGATLDVEYLRGWSTHDDCHSVAIVSNLASPTVIKNPLLSREQREV